MLLLGSLGCGGGDDTGELTCLKSLPQDCTPAFDPTWSNVYSNVVRPSCGGIGSGSSCHAAEGSQGGLELSSSDVAFQALLGMTVGRPRVIPGDPLCSILMERLETSDPALRMPLGMSPLPDRTRCAVQRWIEMGAER